MKKLQIIVSAVAILTAWQPLSTTAQTVNVQTGEVTYAFPAAQTGDMTYADASTLTILQKTFATSEVDQIYIDDSSVTDNTVDVSYSGSTAQVRVAGNVARYLDVVAKGGHVAIVQHADLPDEITYTLKGTATQGSFYMDGSLKATLVLQGVSITNPDSAAINIRCGKRINVELADGTTNTLSDGQNGAQKACFAVKGHTEFRGAGTLNLTGNTAHAFWGKEYVLLKKSVGTINVLKAVGDGFNVNQYFEMRGGNVTINNVGDDGLQLSYKTDDNEQVIPLSEDEDNTALFTLTGGTLNITTSAAAGKAIKSEGSVQVDGGEFIAKVSGSYTYASGDASYAACVKADDTFTLNGGTLTLTPSGMASRGVSANNIVTNGGTLKITGSGAGQIANNTTYTAKGLKADATIALNAGDITITMSGTGGKGIKSSGTYTQGLADGTGPTLVVNTSGSQLGSSSGGGGGRPGGGGWGGSSSTSSSSKGIKVQGAITLRGGTTTVSTKTNGAEGLESKTSITVEGGQHYYACYDDCINSAGAITFAGGATVCYSNGNDAIDSNYGRTGAITIGDGAVFAYTSKGAPEEGFDCDNNSYIQITGKGIGISAGASQGGGGGGWGGWGGSSSSSTISNAAQGYAFVTSSISYQAGRYYTLADASGTNLVTYSFPVAVSSSLGLFTAKGMTKGSSYTIKYSTSEPTDATTAFHGLYIGSTAKGTTSVTSFTAK